MSDCLTLVPKETLPKSNSQKTAGSTSDCITLLLKKIRHICTQNNIAEPFINNMHESDITQKSNSLHQKYVEITKNMWTPERNTDLLVNSNTNLITLLT